ncbi:hypothetical protein D3C83_181780 [compost metagenome]
MPKVPGQLPESGTGLLTILRSGPQISSTVSSLTAFKKLQEELQLTPEKAEAWKAAIREARR